jgi:hypothetical protein
MIAGFPSRSHSTRELKVFINKLPDFLLHAAIFF